MQIKKASKLKSKQIKKQTHKTTSAERKKTK